MNRMLENDKINRKMFRIITQHCFQVEEKNQNFVIANSSQNSRINGWHKSMKSAIEDLINNPQNG